MKTKIKRNLGIIIIIIGIILLTSPIKPSNSSLNTIDTTPSANPIPGEEEWETKRGATYTCNAVEELDEYTVKMIRKYNITIIYNTKSNQDCISLFKPAN